MQKSSQYQSICNIFEVITIEGSIYTFKNEKMIDLIKVSEKSHFTRSSI